MRMIDQMEVEVVCGGVDKNSEAYKIGKDVGDAIKKVGEVAGLAALAIAAFFSGSAS